MRNLCTILPKIASPTDRDRLAALFTAYGAKWGRNRASAAKAATATRYRAPPPRRCQQRQPRRAAFATGEEAPC